MKENLIDDEVLKVKVETFDGMFYTLKTITKKAILKYKKHLEDISNCSQDIEKVCELLVRTELENFIGGALAETSTGFVSQNDLIYLKEENKIINKKDVKQSLIQILQDIKSL